MQCNDHYSCFNNGLLTVSFDSTIVFSRGVIDRCTNFSIWHVVFWRISVVLILVVFVGIFRRCCRALAAAAVGIFIFVGRDFVVHVEWIFVMLRRKIKHGKNTEMCLGAGVVGHDDAFLLVAKRQQQRVDAARFTRRTCYSRCERDFILKQY